MTLVNLPTYFEVRFPGPALARRVDTPDPARLLGYRIDVRPRLKSVTYHLGTATVGPTTSLGGPHPAGDIRATYPRPGTHEISVDIVYTGQFRVAEASGSTSRVRSTSPVSRSPSPSARRHPGSIRLSRGAPERRLGEHSCAATWAAGSILGPTSLLGVRPQPKPS